MATYTTPLKALIEQPTQHRNDLTFKQRLEVGRAVLFDDIDYEFFNDMYRKDFEMKFIRHFYNKEIGFETEGQFKFQLETWLQIHMPYFNELFETQLIKYDPLTNIDMRNAQDITGEHTEDRKQDTTEGRTGTDTTQSSFEHDTTGETDTTTSDTTDQTTESAGTSKSDTATTDTTDSTTDTTGHSDSTTTSENDTTATTDSTGSTDTTSNTTTDEDGRNIQSDTPDKRLQIVDDNGVIQYASEITETSNDATANTTSGTTTEDTSTTTTNATGTDTSETDSTENTIGHSESAGTSETTGSTTDNTHSHSESDGNSHTAEESKRQGWDNAERLTKDDLIGSLTGDVKGTRLEKLQANRYGKDGTVTYQQMIQELRGTFLRIERDIFKEMSELFMLLY